MFFLLYKCADDAVFDDFPKTSDHFPKISEGFLKLFRRRLLRTWNRLDFIFWVPFSFGKVVYFRRTAPPSVKTWALNPEKLLAKFLGLNISLGSNFIFSGQLTVKSQKDPWCFVVQIDQMKLSNSISITWFLRKKKLHLSCVWLLLLPRLTHIYTSNTCR